MQKKTEWFGRIINEKAFDRLAALQASTALSSKVVTGGENDRETKYIEPTVFDCGNDLAAFGELEIMSDEIFGPLLPCCTFSNVDEVVEFVKKLPTGKPLALYAYSTNAAFIKAIKRRTTSGGLCINDNVMHLANHELPFGGVGASGMGAYHGHRSFKTLSHEKAVLEKSPVLDQSFVLKPLLAARFPPYTTTKKLLVAVFGMPIASKAVNLVLPLLKALLKAIVTIKILSLLGFTINTPAWFPSMFF